MDEEFEKTQTGQEADTAPEPPSDSGDAAADDGNGAVEAEPEPSAPEQPEATTSSSTQPPQADGDPGNDEDDEYDDEYPEEDDTGGALVRRKSSHLKIGMNDDDDGDTDDTDDEEFKSIMALRKSQLAAAAAAAAAGGDDDIDEDNPAEVATHNLHRLADKVRHHHAHAPRSPQPGIALTSCLSPPHLRPSQAHEFLTAGNVHMACTLFRCRATPLLILHLLTQSYSPFRSLRRPVPPYRHRH